MNITIRAYSEPDTSEAIIIWNEVVEDGIAFPQTEPLTVTAGIRLFSEQSFTGLVEDQDTGEILGLYTLHPNNVGRCGHISNASYAVKRAARGHGIGEALVRHSIEKSRELGFRILQFNAVVQTNESAIRLYEKLGFVRLGTIPDGFLLKNGTLRELCHFIKHWIDWSLRMKILLRICLLLVGIAMVAAVLYFIVSGIILSVVLSFLMLAILGIVVCEQIRQVKESGQPKSKFYFRLFICGMIFQLVVTIALIVSGNFTFTI